MKSLLAKIALRKGIGLSVGEHEVAVCLVAGTPLGPVKIASSSEPYQPDDLSGVIERQLTAMMGPKRRLPVAVGLPCSRIFFSTRPLAAGGATTPQAMLQKALCSSNIVVDDLAVDLLKGTVNKAAITSVAACRKKYMVGLVATLSKIGVRPVRTEPAPTALVRTAIQSHRLPRRSKMIMQIFFGATQGLAVLCGGGLPLAWRTFPLPASMEGFATLSAVRTLMTQQKHYGLDSSLDYAIVYGRPELHERLQQEQFPTDIGTRVVWHEGPAFDGQAAAYGLALGCLEPEISAFDLSKGLKSRASLWEIFPWWDLAFVSVLVMVMGLVLGYHSIQLSQANSMLQVECSQHKCLGSADAGRLEKERKELADKVEAVRGFLESRICWSAYTNDVSTQLPVNAVLDVLEGTSSLAVGGKPSSKRSFVLRANAPLGQDGGMPREIDTILNGLRKDPVLNRDFGVIEIADIRRASGNRTVPLASFTITCLPGKNPPGPKAGDGGKTTKGTK